MPPKALVFDTFGTIVDWRSSLIADLGMFGAERGLTSDWAGLVDAWRGEYHPSMERVRRGERPWAKLDTLHRESLERLAPRFGLADLAAADLDRLTLLWHRLRPWADAVPGLLRLKRRFVIAPLSNGNVALLTNMAKQAGLPWDAIFGSDVFHHFKPDPETYLGACDLLGLAPGAVMMVAAHNPDLRAARGFGLQTGFFPRPGEYGPAQRQDLAAEEPWDIVARDVEDLATQLGA
jgi:2-haloacid dehalogenase